MASMAAEIAIIGGSALHGFGLQRVVVTPGRKIKWTSLPSSLAADP